MAIKGSGAGLKFLRDLVDDAPTTCAIWPLFRDQNGYGRVGYNGDIYWAHRLSCILAHGDPPSDDHEAAHSCGNGKDGCVNPRHLSWQTRSRNQKDRREHGTKAVGVRRPSLRKLTPEKVDEIRKLRGTASQREIALRFGVSDATIRDIYSGKSWSAGPEAWRELTPDEVREIRKLRDYLYMSEVATMFGITESQVWRVQAGKSYRDVA